MVSLITNSNAHTLIFSIVSSLGIRTNFKINSPTVSMLVKRESFLGFKDFKKPRTRNGILCTVSLENEVELDLENEILEFMKCSKNPNDFPTKKELLEGGRIDLVNAIISKGGWLSLGWDNDDQNESENMEFNDIRDIDTENIIISKQSNDELGPSLNSYSSSCQLFVSPSAGSIETVVKEDAGIEGILHRLERYRSSSFGISMRQNGHDTHDLSKVNDRGRDYVFADVAVAQTDLGEKSNKRENEDSNDDSNYIRSRLQQMQLELSSSLCLLRSKSERKKPDAHQTSSSELQHISDTWEFQENEIMSAKNRLRSIRAELAVLERKMSLSIIEARKVVEAKQKIIDNGCRTLQVLITTCIIWPNSASEVRLAGSFDGWTTQRKMERSQTGVFSFSLKLYPGRYEVKFIVDGVWRVDPLRPVVHYDGYENNVVIVHE
ncbi:protein PTST homolog 2, chloroplastic-like isoform X3 [Rutidosis leptorrhynchoides]|uniref:protein PTST homolog 2, chloroplastic-like isoform X3 n=1 Tax=Rutidosis leptorrhynchoides TaxID=125765 RepID=UPI003A995688